MRWFKEKKLRFRREDIGSYFKTYSWNIWWGLKKEKYDIKFDVINEIINNGEFWFKKLDLITRV